MRRFFICFLCICLLFGSITVTADTNTTDYTAAQEHVSFELMKYLKVIDGNEDYAKHVTRREFALALAKVLDIEPGAYTSRYYYTDTEPHSVINDLTALGYFYGNGEKFSPEDHISIYDACLVALRVLGYQPYLNAIGADTSRIMLTAVRVGIIDEIPENRNLDFATMVVVFNNMLLSEQISADVISGEYHTFSADECLLTQIYDLYYDEGIVIANSVTALYENIKPTSAGMIMVDDTVYEYEFPDAAEMPGRRICFYYEKKDRPTPEIVCLYDDSEDEINLTWKDVVSYDSRELSYYDNNKVRSVTLPEPVVIFNGISDFALSDDEIDLMLRQNGTKIRVNRDGAGKYNYLFVYNYRNGEIRSLDAENQTLYIDFQTENRALKLEELISDKQCIITKMSDGTYMDFSQLKNGDFVSVCVSDNEGFVHIYVCDVAVTGEVKAISTDDTVTIEETEYDVNSEYLLYNSIKIGEQGTYYLDCFGSIAFKTYERSYSAVLGYIDKTDVETTFGDQIFYMIYDENGTHKLYKLADKVTLDGTKAKDTEVHAKLTSYDIFDKHLIGFKTNSSDEIVWIDTAYDTSDGDNTLHMQKEMALMEFEKDSSSGGYQFYKERETDLAAMEVCYPISTGARVIAVPVGLEDKEEHNFNNYSATSTFVSDNEYYVEFYSFDAETPFVEFMLQKADEITYVSDKTECYMVSNVLRSLHTATEDEVSELSLLYCSGYQSTVSYARVDMQIANSVRIKIGNETPKMINGLQISDIISEGDIVQLVKSSDGLVHDMRLLYDLSENKAFWGDSYESMSYANYSGDKEAERYVYGDIDSLYITPMEGEDLYVFALSDGNNPGIVKDMCVVQGNYYRYPIYDGSRIKNKAYIGYMDDLNGAQNTGNNAVSKAFVKMGKNTTAITSVFFYK